MTSDPSRPRNRLANETSPYLLQHAGNPVDWYPWGPEALERSRREAKPIFLSIGYSACHWCHVMERESFEDSAIARLLNERFVSIKVDREERPDLDDIYMKAVLSLTGAGGWPMSVFLTPELAPFHGGTYFPPYARHGQPGFADVLSRVARAWEERPDDLRQQGARLAEQIARESRVDGRGALPPDVLDRSALSLQERYDPIHGGFGGAPKFPRATDLRLLLRHALRTGRADLLAMATHSLERMARGGIHDQLAGGFARYSTDDEWLVPHFEKMLYDNALLVPAYLEAHLATGRADLARVARDACEWALREMRTPEGAFASSQDADSEGEEGRFFVWTPAELQAVLGRELARIAAEWYGVTDEGNFEGGGSVLSRPVDASELARRLGTTAARLEERMEEARRALLAARSRRVPPATDDKVLPAWNGLMISALAQAAQVLGEERYAQAARSAAHFVLTAMRRDDGRLFASARGGRAHLDACLDDYAFLAQGLVDLYETDFDERWLREALALEHVLSERFEDGERGGYYTTGTHHERLIARLKSPHDGALPSGNGVQALTLLRLAELTGRVDLARSAERTLLSVGALVPRYPQAFGQLLIAIDFLQAAPLEIVIAGEADSAAVAEMLAVLRGRFHPQRVVARARDGVDAALVPLVADRRAPPAEARAFVCRNHACRAPLASARALAAELDVLRAAGGSELSKPRLEA